MSEPLLSIQKPATFNELLKHIKPLITQKNALYPYFYLSTDKTDDKTYLTISATDGYRIFRYVYPARDSHIIIHKDFHVYLTYPRMLPRASEPASLVRSKNHTLLLFDNVQQDITYQSHGKKENIKFEAIFDALVEDTQMETSLSIDPVLLKTAVDSFTVNTGHYRNIMDIRISDKKKPIHLTDGINDVFVFPIASKGTRITEYSLLRKKQLAARQAERTDETW